MTAQVATVRHNASVPVNCQMARTEATTATTMHVVVIQNATARTTRGFRNPFCGCRGESGGLAIRTASVAGVVGRGPCLGEWTVRALLFALAGPRESLDRSTWTASRASATCPGGRDQALLTTGLTRKPRRAPRIREPTVSLVTLLFASRRWRVLFRTAGHLVPA